MRAIVFALAAIAFAIVAIPMRDDAGPRLALVLAVVTLLVLAMATAS